MKINKKNVPLIVDPDVEFLDQLKGSIEAKSVCPLVVSNGKEAQRLIADPEAELTAVLVNYKLPTENSAPDCASVVKFSRTKLINTPVYVLNDAGQPAPQQDWSALGVRLLIQKPISYRSILDLVAPHSVRFDPARTLTQFQNEKLDSELPIQDLNFIPILAKDFVAGTTNYFSLYVKAGKDRYIKVCHAGEAFDPDRLQNYLKKGLIHLFIRKEEQEHYLLFKKQISSAIVDTEIKISTQAQLTLNYGHETLHFLKDQGLSSSRIHHAVKFAENSQKIISKMADENQLIQKLMLDMDAYEHGVSVSILTSLIAHHSGVESEKAVQMVGMASLLHDIALVGMEKGFELIPVSEMTEEQKTIYYEHPRKGAEAIESLSGIPTQVVQAIHHHHERRGNQIFDPNQPRPKAVSRMAEFIGIADELLKALEKGKTEQEFDLKSYFQRQIYHGFSPDTTEAFEKAFFPSRRART